MLATVLLAGCSSTGSTTGASGSPATPTSTSASAAQPLAHGVEAPIEAVPWSEVGAGWMLAMWSPVPGSAPGSEPPSGAPTPQTAATTLYLVNPEGGRYAITTFPPPGDGATPTLVDWSGDGHRALFYGGTGSDRTVIEVDLHTGAQTSFTVKNGYNTVPHYTRPEGKAVLLAKSNDSDGPPSLERVDLTGSHQLTYPIEQFGSKFGPEILSTPDGTRLVIGTESGGLAIMANDGTGVNVLPVPGQAYCTPTRWWDGPSTIVVANCNGADFSRSQLWLVPVDGAAPTALTPPNDGQTGPVLGTGAAWQLPEGTFVQAFGACGYRFLAKIDQPGDTPTPVTVPTVGNRDSVDVVGVYHGDLDLHVEHSCGTGESLIEYDPAAGTATVLLGPPVNGGGVTETLPYPGYQ
jgi:hypothetical protein